MRVHARSFLLVLAFSLAPLPALSDAPADCSAAKSQDELTHCAVLDQESAERAVAQEWRAARERLRKGAGPSGRAVDALQKLGSLQRLWKRLVRDQCAFEGSLYEGGSIQPMIVARCHAREARNRESALRPLAVP